MTVGKAVDTKYWTDKKTLGAGVWRAFDETSCNLNFLQEYVLCADLLPEPEGVRVHMSVIERALSCKACTRREVCQMVLVQHHCYCLERANVACLHDLRASRLGVLGDCMF